jgi:hypothetical protein
MIALYNPSNVREYHLNGDKTLSMRRPVQKFLCVLATAKSTVAKRQRVRIANSY